MLPTIQTTRLSWTRKSFWKLAIIAYLAGTHPFAVVLATTNAAVDLGTTLVAVKYHGGVVVAADSQTSLGRYVSNREADKLERFITDRCVILRSGSAAETQFLVREGRRFFQDRARRYSLLSSSSSSIKAENFNTPTVSQVAHWMRRAVLTINKSRNAGTVSLIVAGYDMILNDNNTGDGVVKAIPKAQIYSIYPSGALILNDDNVHFAAAGSGSTYILGFLDHEIQNKLALNKQSGDIGIGIGGGSMLTQAQAIDLCKSAVELAIARDGSSGGQIRMCILDSASRSLSSREFDSQPRPQQQRQDEEDNDNERNGSFLPGFAAPETQYDQ